MTPREHDAALAASDEVASSMALDMDSCMGCHARKSASNDCVVCHTQIRADAPPANHGLSWKADHGRVFRSCGAKEEQRCSLCHEEASCERCHRVDRGPLSSFGRQVDARSHGQQRRRVHRNPC